MKKKAPLLKFRDVHPGTIFILAALPRDVVCRIHRDYVAPWGYDMYHMKMGYMYYHIQNNKELYLQYLSEMNRQRVINEINKENEAKKKQKRWYSPFLRRKRDE